MKEIFKTAIEIDKRGNIDEIMINYQMLAEIDDEPIEYLCPWEYYNYSRYDVNADDQDNLDILSM